jgi:6-phosphogluconolactonase (cycloisomerase 2 family)
MKIVKTFSVLITILIGTFTTYAQTSNVYINTNEKQNKIIHFECRKDGKLVEIEKVNTGGEGTGGYKPITGEASAPDPLISDGALKISKDHRWLFVVNAGSNSISSFRIESNGKLKLADTKSTNGKVPCSLAFNDKSNVLYVLHSYGPDQIKLFKVDEGKLHLMDESYSINYGAFTDRLPSSILLSPDGKYLITSILYNQIIRDQHHKIKKVVAANEDTKDGLMVFPVMEKGTLGTVVMNSSGGAGPFGSRFLHNSNTHFVTTLDDGNGVVFNRLDANGSVKKLSSAKAEISNAVGAAGLCWVSISADNKYAYVSSFDVGAMVSFKLKGDTISQGYSGIGKIQGNGYVKSGTHTSGPVGNWASKDGYLYQLYPNAGKIVAFKMRGADLIQIGTNPIPVNSPQGIDGY